VKANKQVEEENQIQKEIEVNDEGKRPSILEIGNETNILLIDLLALNQS